jgi:hypothetical protein
MKREGKLSEIHYDLLSVFMVCVGSPDSKDHAGVLRLLNALFSQHILGKMI